MKVVFDSSIYVSAFATPGGIAEKAILGALEGAFVLAFSRPILDEVLRILARKLARDSEELFRIAFFISSAAELVKPIRRIHVLADEPDNRILECAPAAHADVIVTGDRALLAIGAYEGIQILTLREFVDALGPGGSLHEKRARYRIGKRKKLTATV